MAPIIKDKVLTRRINLFTSLSIRFDPTNSASASALAVNRRTISEAIVISAILGIIDNQAAETVGIASYTSTAQLCKGAPANFQINPMYMNNNPSIEPFISGDNKIVLKSV